MVAVVEVLTMMKVMMMRLVVRISNSSVIEKVTEVVAVVCAFAIA